MTDNKTLISDILPYEEVVKRKVFIIFDEMITPEIFKVFKLYTDNTGIKFHIEHNEGFKTFKKVYPSCQCCGNEGDFEEDFCNDCIIIEYGDSSIQAKRRGIGMFR